MQTNVLRAVLAVCLSAFAPAGVNADETDDARPRFALLVGVGRYAHLSAAEQLDGCRNDVAAMQDLLRTRFGFEDEDVVTLLDEEATGERIRREMQRLRDRAAAAAQGGATPVVVFHYSGHGSQVLDQPEGDPDCDEEDGLDETLVPHDATKQGGDQDVRDDEIFAFAEALCGNGRSRLWMILDCCHSGTGARGATKVRKLVRGDLRPATGSRPRKVQPKRLPPGAVFLSACRAREVEPEYQDGDRTYGLLTRFLVQVLNEESAVSKLTYDLLREAIVARYRRDRSVAQAPVPTLEYGDPQALRQTIVDGAGLDRRPLWTVKPAGSDRNRVLMTAGALHGVTAGSLFELYESPEQVVWEAEPSRTSNGPSLAWLEVEQVEGASATCRLFRYDGDERIDATLESSLKRGFAVERLHDHGDARLRVRVVRSVDELRDGPPLTADDASVPAAVRQALGSAVRKDESPWLQWTSGKEPCDVLLRFDGHDAALFPATGVPRVEPAVLARTRGDVPRTLVGGWGPIDLRTGEQAVERLQDFLRRITRARNLIAIAARQSAATEGRDSGGAAPVQVRLELVAVDEVNDDFEVTKSHVWEPEEDAGRHSGQRVMRDGDRFTFRVVNEEAAGKPVFVTVLHVDSNMGIDQIHPWQPEAGAPPEGAQKLGPGESLLVDGYFVCNGEEDEVPVYGHRWVIVLATRTPNQFYLLAQEGLPTTRDAASPLEGLLLEQTEFKTRGGFSRRRRRKSRYDDSWGARAVRWIVVPRDGN